MALAEPCWMDRWHLRPLFRCRWETVQLPEAQKGVPTADNFEKLDFLEGNLHLLNKNWPSSVVEMDEEKEESVFQTNMVLFPLDLKKKNKLGGKE